MQGALRIIIALCTPEWSIFDKAIFSTIDTIYMAFMATCLATPPAVLLGFLAARNLMKQSRVGYMIYFIVRLVINVSRSIEPLIWAIVFSVWVGIGPCAGMLALWLHSIAALTKLFSEQIESVSHGPLEAMAATGAHPVQVIRYGVVPQVVLPFLSFTIYRWDINLRMATIIGLVGGGGIGTLLNQYQGLAMWHEVGLILIVIVVAVWAMDYASARLREAIK
jgi:phosphonate transport system permease protein